jgi:hypothetical protein
MNFATGRSSNGARPSVQQRMKRAIQRALARGSIHVAHRARETAAASPDPQRQLLAQLQTVSPLIRGRRSKLVAPVATWVSRYAGMPDAPGGFDEGEAGCVTFGRAHSRGGLPTRSVR